MKLGHGSEGLRRSSIPALGYSTCDPTIAPALPDTPKVIIIIHINSNDNCYDNYNNNISSWWALAVWQWRNVVWHVMSDQVSPNRSGLSH